MEVSVGKQVQQDVIRQYGGLSTDPIATQRVARIGRQVAAVSPRRDVTYTYQVLNSNIINAFAAPGGPVLITKRLVDMLTDSQLAFVLAHETGHIAAQHGRDAINRALLAQGIGSLLFGSSSSAITQGVNIMYTLYNRGYSRSQEYQADTYGVQIMAGAGYNQEAAIEALAKLGMQRTGGINRYLSTHPDVPDRINRVASLIGISQAREQQLIRQAQAQPGAR
ncbi:MAG: M48 family metalloprotease [Armatimonadota bacterium]